MSGMLCAEVWDSRIGAYTLTCIRGDDSASGRAWLRAEIRKQFGDVPSSLLRLGSDGRYTTVPGQCEGGCHCPNGTCPGRKGIHGPDKKPRRGPGPQNTPVHAEDVDEDHDRDGDGDGDEVGEHLRDPMNSGGEGKKPAAGGDGEPTMTLAELHDLIEGLWHHHRRTRARKQLDALQGLAPRTLANANACRTLTAALERVTPPPRRRSKVFAMLTSTP